MAHVQGLRCRECGREYEIAPIFTCEWCFGPLEVAYDYDAIAGVDQPGEDRRRARSRIWRYADLLPGRAQPRGRPRRRLHAARARRPPRRRARPRRGVDQERHAEPDELVQGPGHVGRAVEGARVRVQDRGVRVDGQPRRTRSPRTRRTRGCAASCSSPPNLEQGKIVTTAVYGGNVVAIDGNYDDVNRLCAELAGTYPWAFVNVNVRTVSTPRARRRSRSRPPSSSAGRRPTTSSCRSPAARCSPRSARASTSCYKVGLLDEEPQVRVSGRAGARVLAGRDRVARRRPTPSSR